MAEPLRLVLVSLIPDARHTGMGKWSHEMAAALHRRGHAPTLWFADRFPALARAGRAGVLLGPLLVAVALARARGAFDAAVVHEPSGLWYGLGRRLLFPEWPPLLAMCHNVERRTFRDLVGFTRRGCAAVPVSSRLKAPLFRFWQSDGAIRLADHVLCLSTTDERYLTGEVRLPPDRVTRFANGAPPGSPAAAPRAGQRVLFVGGWVDVKGRRVLPALWHAVRRRVPAARLTLVGTGVAADTLRAAFAETDRDSLDPVDGFADDAAMRALLGDHDVLLVPSLSEGSPLIVLEAMTAGLPVAATSVGGIPDLVRDGTDALLFPPCDPAAGAAAVAHLLIDPARAARLAASARNRVAAFTWDAAAAAVERAARQVLA